MIDGVNYTASHLPVSFYWDNQSSHTFHFWSPLTVNANTSLFWNNSTGLSSVQSGSLTVTSTGYVSGNYGPPLQNGVIVVAIVVIGGGVAVVVAVGIVVVRVKRKQ
jgi:hypothetical protein